MDTNTIAVLDWPSVKLLEAYLSTVRKELSSGAPHEADHIFNSVFEGNLLAFKDDIAALPESLPEKAKHYAVLVSMLLNDFNGFVELRLAFGDQTAEGRLCLSTENLILSYFAQIVRFSIDLDPVCCIYSIANSCDVLPSGISRQKVLIDIAGVLGITEESILWLKCRQCNKCKVRHCDGRYSDILCGKPELLYVDCDNLIIDDQNSDIIKVHSPSSKEAQAHLPYDSSATKSKSKLTEKLICPEVHSLISELAKKGFCRYNENRWEWIKDMNTYSYYCYKMTDVFVGRDAQIEVNYISKMLVWCPGDPRTQGNYARRYRQQDMAGRPRKKPVPPEAKIIDNLIIEAYKGYYSRAK